MKDYKIVLIVFLFLATIVSLFPPFEIGNELLRTQQERNKYSEIMDNLPLKRYDFLFSKTKKSYPIGEYFFEEKVYDNQKSTIDLSDAYKALTKTGVDTFKSIDWTKVNEVKEKPMKKEESKPFSSQNKTQRKVKNVDYNKWHDNFIKKWLVEHPEDDISKPKKIDSIKSYKIYKITEPNWYVLKRELLINELFLEYFLALILSALIQLIFIWKKRYKT